ncbi:MGH1-like glycoside hydrolase domain-containing protein [Natrialbaceae archaeon A-arb3/5]
MGVVETGRYYGRELVRRLSHYAETRRRGYHDFGSLERAAEAILASRAQRGFESGGHFRGVWPRDLCFAARGLSAAGYDDATGDAGDWLVEQLRGSNAFYTDFHGRHNAATPAEGVDTFPAIVILLAEAGRLDDRAEAIADLAVRHRERFVGETGLVTGNGSSWWDSAVRPREAYNTAMLLAAIERLESHGIETTFTGESAAVREALVSRLWNGDYVDEHRESATLACDANVVPLYFGLLDDERAAALVDSLADLETPRGIRMRARPFSHAAVHPFFLLHRDYHYHIWPWNSAMYAIGLARYGYEDRARREMDRLEGLLGPYGNFLEVCTLDGEPYIKRGYASAAGFTVAAALWTEYCTEYGRMGERSGRIP